MAKKLKNIEITHISLVKAGANNRTFIYKSKAADPAYENIVQIAKQDVEKGIVYGIVYEPDTVDAQGDFATAEEIQKAAYGFMKALNNRNVDKNHAFKGVDAYVAESWIVRKGDTLFPDAKEGTWAVAIQLESDAIKKSVKNGEFEGLSMAGTAIKEDVQKAADDKGVVETIKSIFTSIAKSFASEKNTAGELNKEEIEKAIKEQLEPILKEKTELQTKLTKAESDVTVLTKERDELKVLLTKSKQATEPSPDTSKVETIIKAAREYIKKEAEEGNTVSVAEAVMKVTKGE
ncbi:MAG: XkdF-like putative serine protease domain-containing protein [Campylobacteraceae bacterium]|jgi:hypothetical protein|nr:XkdF-like putative serine protease domain-containing protein [Campylobacteraceae bacterium]